MKLVISNRRPIFHTDVYLWIFVIIRSTKVSGYWLSLFYAEIHFKNNILNIRKLIMERDCGRRRVKTTRFEFDELHNEEQRQLQQVISYFNSN